MANSKAFRFLLGADFETTGVCMGQKNPVHNPVTGERHQAVSGGFLVIDTETFKIVEELYLEIAWNEESIAQRESDPKFGTFAEGIHGLKKDYLEKTGVDESEAVEEIANLVVKYWGLNSPISMLGHNVQFDREFLQDMFGRYELPFRFSQRNVDSFSVGLTCWRAFDSDELFDITSASTRGTHNALDDIKLTLNAVKVTRTLFERYVQ